MKKWDCFKCGKSQRRSPAYYTINGDPVCQECEEEERDYMDECEEERIAFEEDMQLKEKLK